MVIRDLTLRSAASFGSFHLIRLLYDEYMFFLIEHKVAQSLGETTIGVMGNHSGLGEAPGGGAGSIDLPASTPAEVAAASLPRSGTNIDALLIDHEMLTKPTFDISSSPATSGVAAASTAAKMAFAASPATSVAKLISIPTSTTINNNNASSLTASSVNELVDLAQGGVIQAPMTPGPVPSTAVPTSKTEDARGTGQEKGLDGVTGVPSNSASSSVTSGSTTSLTSSTSVQSLSAPVGVIKQAGSGVVSAATPPAVTAAQQSGGGPAFLMVEEEALDKKPELASLKGSLTKDGNKDGSDDVGEPAAKRVRTE